MFDLDTMTGTTSNHRNLDDRIAERIIYENTLQQSIIPEQEYRHLPVMLPDKTFANILDKPLQSIRLWLTKLDITVQSKAGVTAPTSKEGRI